MCSRAAVTERLAERWQASFISKTIQGLINPAEPETKGQRAQGTGLRNVLGKTEADAVVLPVAGLAPVAVGDTQKLWFVAPGAAPKLAQRTFVVNAQ